MLKTRFTGLLGIRHPIMQGGMQHLGVPELAAAVSNAGGLGTINMSIYPKPEDFRAAVRRTKSLTSMPFCVNISLLPELNSADTARDCISICAEEGVSAIETAGQNPAPLVPLIKSAGMTLIHKCPSVRHALKAEAAGADAVSIVSYEAGGHPGLDELGGFILINRAAASLRIPVLAAGGIADGKGLAAALALGAEGIVMGTRFVATQECPAHRNFKDAVVSSGELDTTTCLRSVGNTVRCFKNECSMQVIKRERQGASLPELMPLISGAISGESYVTGNTQNCIFAVGPSVGLIPSVRPVGEVLEEIVCEALSVIDQLNLLRTQ